MITREEFDRDMSVGSTAECIIASLAYIETLEQHIKSLEAQLCNTEQLTCESCDFCGEDCAVLEILMSQFGFEVENCICPNYKLKDTQ